MLVLLCILDGFGLRQSVESNAIAAAKTPNFDKLKSDFPHTSVETSGLAVGLPGGQMGNSEVGHLNIGAGRIVYQDVTRIDKAISDGDFFRNDQVNNSLKRLADDGKTLHLIGLVSDGKVHSSLDHLYALVELAKQRGVKKVCLHAMLDGRDTLPRSGAGYVAEVLAKFDEIGLGTIATVGGRYHGMDRDQRWERTDLHYHAIVNAEGERWDAPVAAIKASYEHDISDEFMVPVIINQTDTEAGKLTDGDIAMMFNFRSDRMRQIAYMFADYKFDDYDHPNNPKVELYTMTSYDAALTEAKVLFGHLDLSNILGQVISEAGIKQLRTAETEKYAHVTFFFNGGIEEPFEGEERDLIPSPKVATYDLQPEMSSVAVTDNLVARIKSKEFGLIVANYANCDMVGHTGDFDAAIKAVEAVDNALGRVLKAVKDVAGVALVTADHGNAEMMVDPETGSPWTAHTTNPVPCVLYDPEGHLGSFRLLDGGGLADLAPTILEIFDMAQPDEMTGKSLLKRT
ncbi:MAG: 2,3-bisphosphoglycerate-independent phosphoglycerate mutase [candidate division Zixibacteria bacterium]